MNGLQAWFFLAVLAALGLRGLDRLRLTAGDLGYVGAALALAVLQHVFTRQFTLDECYIAPWILALPVIAGARGGVRAGLATGVGSWLALTALASTLPVRIPGELPQEVFVIAAMVAGVLGAAAGSVRADRRWTAGLLPLAWIFFLAMRDGRLALEPTVVAVPLLASAWSLLAIALAPLSVRTSTGASAPALASEAV